MTILLPAHKINPPEWMRDPDLIRVLDILNYDDINARMVGGCIRNHYMSKNIYDIDIACKLSPEILMELLSEHGIRTIPTGIKHGTITAHINGRNFEITTLRRDTNTDGRHAIVEYTDDWAEDAKRRDFTINALYADRDGSIYDPTELGLRDLQEKTVRFIGDPEQRITEDYLRILRFFRFTAIYGSSTPHTDSYEACANLKDGLNQLSDERIHDEIFKILADNTAPTAINLMQHAGIFEIPGDAHDHLKNLIALQNQLACYDINSRYFIIKIDKKYIKNNKINSFFKLINDFQKSWNGNIKLALYRFERPVVIQGLLILKSQGTNITDIQIASAMNDVIPTLPVVASDIMEHFKIPQGPEVGERIKQAESLWIDSGFKMNHLDILHQMTD